MSGKVLSPPAQRASIEAAAARLSSGNSRMMRRTLPVSMYFSLSAGSTLLWKLAQWPQVIEAYSTTVIGASALPSTRSGSGPGFISSSERDLGRAGGLLALRQRRRGQSPGGGHGQGGDTGRELQEVAPREMPEARRQGR